MEENAYSWENPEYRKTYHHTCSHVMAQAICRLYPGTKLAIGPAIEEGFYYDIDSEHTFSPDDFEAIEKEMRKICKEKLKLERFELPRAEAVALMEKAEQPYKVELINDLPEDAVISFYRQGEFTDLCAGPHLDSTGRIKGNGIKITNVTGAYWRGDSKRKMLQRFYAVSFPSKDMLDEYLARIEEAKKRDHRKLGKELGLFTLMDEGPGFPFFLPKGMVLRNTLIDYWRQVHKRYGYVEISTPMILNRALWERSGHWEHYKQNMYTTVIDGEDYAIKPMNCPGGMLVYKSEPHSYRDLPLRGVILEIRQADRVGVLHGMEGAVPPQKGAMGGKPAAAMGRVISGQRRQRVTPGRVQRDRGGGHAPIGQPGGEPGFQSGAERLRPYRRRAVKHIQIPPRGLRHPVRIGGVR